MDISSRIQSPSAAPGGHHTSTTGSPRKSSSDNGGIWGRIGVVAAVVAIVVLLIAVAVLASTGDSSKNEAKYVDSSKLQAVFLNTGQVYFGNITALNSKYAVLSNIYYLQTSNNGQSGSSTNASPNVTLVKLGCELHEPFDRMVINRDQITFWENLHEGGQVAKAVATFKQQNPNGQKCADQSTSSSTNSASSTQNANGNNSSSNSSSTTPAKP